MPLHNSCRPQELNQIIGNRETVAAVGAILDRKHADRPHAWLFTGPTGSGKTTTARIVARRLGIADADLVELNLASTRGIDTARDIQERMRLRPLGSGGARGWILDEAHMGTKEFWNAMLKPLEDAPAHVYFFICTTDPQKLLATVRSRCEAAHFKFEALAPRQVQALLAGVVKAEDVDVPQAVTDYIAANCGGSARAAVGMLDKVIDMPAAEMLAAVERAGQEQVESIELCRALINGVKWPQVAAILKGMADFDAEQVRQHVLAYCNSVLLGGKGDNLDRVWLVMDSFRDPADRNGRPGITHMAYMAINAK